jgi:hypothetical protein
MEIKVSKINVVASSACEFNSTEVPQIRSSVEFLKKLWCIILSYNTGGIVIINVRDNELTKYRMVG